jgi:hypothetical protein
LSRGGTLAPFRVNWPWLRPKSEAWKKDTACPLLLVKLPKSQAFMKSTSTARPSCEGYARCHPEPCRPLTRSKWLLHKSFNPKVDKGLLRAGEFFLTFRLGNRLRAFDSISSPARRKKGTARGSCRKPERPFFAVVRAPDQNSFL